LQNHGEFVVSEGKKTLYSPIVSKKPAGPYQAVFEETNNFVVLGAKGKEVWTTNTKGKGHKGAGRAVMQNDGNFVVYSSKTTAVWNSNAAEAALHPRIVHGNGVHYGVDVSSYQSFSNHQAVVDHLKGMGGGATPFCFIKISEGSSYVWSEAQSHISAFIKAGCLTGAYHFFHSASGVSAQLNRILSLKGEAKYVMIDAELDEAGAAGNLVALIKELHSHGIKPLLYTAGWLASQWGAESWGVPMWIASYGSAPSVHADIWQYTSTGVIPGISTVDIDKSTCSEARFEEIFY